MRISAKNAILSGAKSALFGCKMPVLTGLEPGFSSGGPAFSGWRSQIKRQSSALDPW
jgi:hypothetical protein